MEDKFKALIEQLKADPKAALEKLKETGKKIEDIAKYRKEYAELNREERQQQVGRVQEDKTVGNNTVYAVKLPINYQKKIVTTSAAWEVGEPVTLTPKHPKEKTDTKLHDLLMQIWRANRVDNLIYKAVVQKKSETQSALLFYIKEVKEGSMLQKALMFLGITDQKKEIGVSLLENRSGTMYPYFDEYGDMKAFVWEFSKLKEDGKEGKFTWVYDDRNRYQIIDEGIPEVQPHGFDKIPVVYMAQDNPEWFDVNALIDRREVTLSKLCDSNDRVAYPILKTYGRVQSLPQASDSGKVLNFPMEYDEDAKKHVHGDAEFLTLSNAPEAIKLEMRTLEDDISFISSTPFMSLSKMIEIGGNVATATVKLMFTDAEIKAKANQGENRTMVERILSVLMSGITTTTNTKLINEAKNLYYEVEFNSILPGDLKEATDIAVSLKSANLASRKTLLRYLDMNEDVDAEMALIDEDAAKEPKEPIIEP